MANRKNLKKTIHYIAENLMSELTFKCLMSGKQIDAAKVEELALAIQAQEKEFIARVSHFPHASGAEGRKQVSEYAAALYKDWDAGVGEVFGRIEAL